MKTQILFLWLFCAKISLGQDWIQVERYEAHVEDVYASDADDTLSRPLRSVASDAGDIHSADSEETEVLLDEDGRPRDKRTLGFIVQGLASALGYTLTPLQVASLPNPSPPPPSPPAQPAPKTPVAPPKAPAPTPLAKPLPPAPPAPPAKAPAPPPQPRQRETIRITGLVNFGPNANSNLPAQLGQYEQLFHGNAVGAVPAPSPARPPVPAPAPAPAPAPVPKPTLPKIPSPIVPNLSPLLPPSRPPISMPGSTATKPRAGSPTKQEVETEYRKNENLEKFNVENKEIHGDRNLFTELPGSAYVQEPDWRHGYIARLQELEERQKEYADRLQKHEALLVKQQQDHENTDERFVNREKEIAERDEAHTARLRDKEEERIRQQDKERSKPDIEDSREEYEEDDKPSEGYKRPVSSESDEEHPNRYENEEERSPQQYSDDDEEPKKYLDYEDYPQKYSSYESEDGEKLPISRDKEMPKSEDVRNSYGESLEDQGQIDENIADYFVKFKDSNTGLYIPEKTQNAENYNKEKEPWWKGSQDAFDGRIENLRNEYSSPAPESKYEEYELEEGSDERTKSAEKLEHTNETDETTSQPDKVQNIPDYSEAFGGYEPYAKELEPEDNQEISSPSTNTAESPRSELKQESNESEESEKSEDQKEIPFYHFDFKSFMPYHSPIRYIYGSDDAESGLPRIQSYNQNSNAPNSAESMKEDLPVEREEPKEEHRSPIGLPEKLIMRNLHDGEAKELHAWPAPFDYVFDSTEQTNVAELPRIQAPPGTELPVEADDPYPNEGLQATPRLNLLPEYDTAFRNQHGIRQRENDTPERFHGHFVETQNLQENPKNYGIHEYPRPTNAHEDTSRQSQVLYDPAARYNFHEDNRQLNHDERSPQDKHSEQRALQPPELENRGYIFSEYPFVNHERGYETNKRPEHASSRPVQTPSSPSIEERNGHKSRHHYQPPESQYRTRINHEDAPISQNAPSRHFGPENADLRNRGQDFSQNYTPSEPRLSGRRFDENRNQQVQNQDQGFTPHQEDKSSLRFEDPKSAHDFFGFSQNDYDYDNNEKIEKSQSLVNNNEAHDLLVVADPPPYQYDVKLTEFTDEPESDTEKVKVKEYRNKMATVTISEKKQLSPEGPVHLIGYSHHF